jgi:dimeric dUTPase (all-alpha-NTP-PPase superfamily)
MANIRGKAYAINVLTPMKRWKTPLLLAAFKLFSIKLTQWELRALAFIHFARWTVIAAHKLPRFPEMQERETLTYNYLLFESNFNGSWNEYIDAFHSVLSFKLNLVWLWSENFPGSVPLTPFKKYIDRNQLFNDYFYMAYPGATVRDVKNALDSYSAFVALAEKAECSDDEFATAYLEFATKVQNKLGANGNAGPDMT